MRVRIISVIILGLLAFVIVVGFTADSADHRTTWDYKVVENSWDEKQMSNLGAEGWELVAVDASRGDKVRSFFKREHLHK